MNSKTSLGLALLCFSGGLYAHQLYPQVDTPNWDPEMLVASQVPDRLISDSGFVYRPYFHPFDIRTFLQQHRPDWQELAESVNHWAGATGVDPRVILTTMAVLTDEVAETVPSAQQVKDVANQLSQRFYHYQDNLTAEQHNAATLAIVRQLQSPGDWQRWQDQYQAWFGSPDVAEPETAPQQAQRSTGFAPAYGFMQWPWRQGYSWIPNGPHAHSGSGFPLSSIDVSYDWPAWGAPTYSVTAAHDGYVTVMSRCQVRVTNHNGWATNYYHMDGIQVANNQWVSKDTKLGVYASQRSTALCEGGSSTGPHLHFSLLYQGRFQSLQGSSLGPYQVQTGRYSYDNNCQYTWLLDQRSQQKVCLWRRVDNPTL